MTGVESSDRTGPARIASLAGYSWCTIEIQSREGPEKSPSLRTSDPAIFAEFDFPPGVRFRQPELGEKTCGKGRAKERVLVAEGPAASYVAGGTDNRRFTM